MQGKSLLRAFHEKNNRFSLESSPVSMEQLHASNLMTALSLSVSSLISICLDDKEDIQDFLICSYFKVCTALQLLVYGFSACTVSFPWGLCVTQYVPVSWILCCFDQGRVPSLIRLSSGCLPRTRMYTHTHTHTLTNCD